MQAFFCCLVVYGKIDTAAPIARRVVQALPLPLAAHNWLKNQQFAIDPPPPFLSSVLWYSQNGYDKQEVLAKFGLNTSI